MTGTQTLMYLGGAVVAIALVAAALIPKGKGRSKKGVFVKKRLATANEQPMYWRLVACFPELAVLTQVSFGALLQAKGGASRYSFAQKIADFVLIDRSFEVIAIIELDDSSHNGKEDKDASRDAMLIEAGYRVLRYGKTPDEEKLKSDVNALKAKVKQ